MAGRLAPASDVAGSEDIPYHFKKGNAMSANFKMVYIGTLKKYSRNLELRTHLLYSGIFGCEDQSHIISDAVRPEFLPSSGLTM
jgi:hypothetical protein